MLYCASITKTDIADTQRFFREIYQLIHEYCLTTQILPQYFKFTIEPGTILLDSTSMEKIKIGNIRPELHYNLHHGSLLMQ
jgi:hypothetical protein